MDGNQWTAIQWTKINWLIGAIGLQPWYVTAQASGQPASPPPQVRCSPSAPKCSAPGAMMRTYGLMLKAPSCM